MKKPIQKPQLKTFKVTYTKAIGEEATINVLAHNKYHSLMEAERFCYTGDEFRNPVRTDEVYIHPRLQGRNLEPVIVWTEEANEIDPEAYKHTFTVDFMNLRPCTEEISKALSEHSKPVIIYSEEALKYVYANSKPI